MTNTPRYTAPEVFNKETAGTISDIWSLGCTIYEMIHKQPPWSDLNILACIQAICNENKEIPKLGKNLSDDLDDFYKCCLIRDSHKRWSASKLLEHPFLRIEVNSKFQVYLSYLWDSKETAKLFKQFLEKNNIEVLIDYENVEPYEYIHSQISKAIENSDLILCFITRNCDKSEKFSNVINYAHKLNKKILPVFLEEIDLKELKITGLLKASLIHVKYNHRDRHTNMEIILSEIIKEKEKQLMCRTSVDEKPLPKLTEKEPVEPIESIRTTRPDITSRTYDSKVSKIDEDANLLKSKNEHDKVLECCKEKLDLAVKNFDKNSKEVAEVYTEIASCYKIMGYYDQAIYALKKSIDIYALKGDKEFDSKTRELCLQIGTCFYEDSKFTQALQFFKDALFLCNNDIEKRTISKLIKHSEDYLKANKFEFKHLLISSSWDSSIKVWGWNSIARNTTCIQTIPNASGQVNCLALIRKYLLISGHDENVIKIWDLITNECIQVLQAHDGEVMSIAILNQDLFASASYDGKICLWRNERVTKQVDLAANYEEFLEEQSQTNIIINFKLEDHVNAQQGLLHSLCSIKWNRLASGGDDYKISIWDFTRNRLNFMKSLEGHLGAIKCLLQLNGACFVSGSEDHTIRLWNLNDFTCTSVLNEHDDYVNSLVSLRNGIFASGSRDDTIKIWKLDEEESKSKFTIICDDHRVKSLRDVGDQVIASGDAFGNINLWSIHDYTLLHTFKAHDDAVSSLQSVFREEF